MDDEFDDEFYCQIKVTRKIDPTHSKCSTFTVELDTSNGIEMLVNGYYTHKLSLIIQGEYEWASFKNSMLAEFIGEKLDA